MIIANLSDEVDFPSPYEAAAMAPLAYGGDLSPRRLLEAYRQGIFPWYDDADPILWWSPDPRMVFDLHKEEPMRVRKSLRQSLRNKGFTVTWDTYFETVMLACAAAYRPDQYGTWIDKDMVRAYTRLHKLGHARSVEIWQEGVLVGGLYGVDLKEKQVFCGESMFHNVTDASKVALYHAINHYKELGYRYIDCQMPTDHLKRLGGMTLSRKQFLDYLNQI